jgi:DNA-binding transcriptional ArsR family regulator
MAAHPTPAVRGLEALHEFPGVFDDCAKRRELNELGVNARRSRRCPPESPALVNAPFYVQTPALAHYAPDPAYAGPMPRQRSSDLFPTDQPIPAGQMIGRAADVREIATALEGGGNLIVAGPRRTGKTSVCDAAVGQLARRGFYDVSIDLFRIASAAEFAEALVAATISNRSALRRVIHQTRRAGRLVADALHTSAVIKSKAQLGEELEIAFSPGLAARDPERYLDYALALPGRIADADGKPVVVFIDEFQEIGAPHHPYGDTDRLTKRMRAIFQRTNGVSYLFAGSLEHLMRDLFTPADRALHQFGGFHDLRPIDHDAWVEGLSERFAADDCAIEPAALNRIIEYGDAQPRSTMLIAQKSHLTTIELDVQSADLSIIEQGLLVAMSADRIAHEQIIERIRRAHRLGLIVAERIARDQPVYTGLARGAVRRALEALRDEGIIDSQARGDWRITSPLFRRYLTTVLLPPP